MTETEFATCILFGETLAEKLVSPTAILTRAERPESLGDLSVPGRPPELRLNSKGTRGLAFPARDELAGPEARGRVLHFFANHELLALELMALALLRFTDAPAAFRRGIVNTMREEQAHMRLYLTRMQELGVVFGEMPVSDFFWSALKGMRTPYEYVAGMSLTFEQANLDFSLFYQSLFAELGDEATAAILERVYREEIGHVQHGLAWFERWRPKGQDLWQSYIESLKQPLSPARAKALPFNRDGRKDAGLSEEFIQRLELFGGSKGRPPAVLWFNPDVELEVAHALAGGGQKRAWNAYRTKPRHAAMIGDADVLMTFVAQTGDIVLCRQEPGVDILADWHRLGVALPEFLAAPEPLAALRTLGRERLLREIKPWGFGPGALRADAELKKLDFDKDAAGEKLWRLYAKTELPELRAAMRRDVAGLSRGLGPDLMDGRLVRSGAELEEVRRETAASLNSPVLVKAPFSAAGRERLRLPTGGTLTPAQQGWLDKGWAQWGALLVEPLVDVVFDGSILTGLAPTHFFTDKRGQYLGHYLLPRGFADFSEPVRTLLLTAPAGAGASLAAVLTDTASRAFAHLETLGHTGPAGIDFHIYRVPAGPEPERLYLQAVGEVNARTTMGHVAAALTKLLAVKTRGLWATVRSQDLPALGLRTFSDLAASLRREHPMQLGGQGRARLTEGVFFTNDPKTAEHGLGVVGAGEAAVRLASLLFAPGKSVRDAAG